MSNQFINLFLLDFWDDTEEGLDLSLGVLPFLLSHRFEQLILDVLNVDTNGAAFYQLTLALALGQVLGVAASAIVVHIHPLLLHLAWALVLTLLELLPQHLLGQVLVDVVLKRV